MSALNISRHDKVLRLAGSLRIDDIVPALAGLKKQCAQALPEVIDLAGVTACDSAGVALMLELRRMGVKQITHLPADMVAIVEACQIHPLLPANRSVSDRADASTYKNENS
ncbi:MAG: STAS domain-containing protein [Halothiobacillaceae bacterium]|nr:MAG: STAS domain-containing protein [Halothiobacillaceae bacterium]